MMSRSAPIHRQTTRPHQCQGRSQVIHCRCHCCRHRQSIPQQTRSTHQLRPRHHRSAPPLSRPPTPRPMMTMMMMMMMMMCRHHAQPRFRHSRSRRHHSGIRCRQCRSRLRQRLHTCRHQHQHLHLHQPMMMRCRCIPTRHRCHRPTTRPIVLTHRRCRLQHRLRPSQSSRLRSILMMHHHRCRHSEPSPSHQLQCHLQHRPPLSQHHHRCRRCRQRPVCCRQTSV